MARTLMAYEVHRALLTMSAPTAPNESPLQASVQIVDSVRALVRAEIKLLWSHARRLGSGAAIAVGLTWIAMTLTQISLLVLALSPLFAATFNAWTVAASVAPVTLLTILAWVMTLRSWRMLLDDKREQSKKTNSPALDLQNSDLQRR